MSDNPLCTSVEGNLQLGEAMLLAAGVTTRDITSLVETLRQDDYALIRRVGRTNDPAFAEEKA